MSLFGSSSPFGASTTSPFGAASPSMNPFAASAPSNPFAANQSTSIFGAKPFGSPTFGASTTNSPFAGTATGVFGTGQASPLSSSTPAFGASSAPAFGSSPSFGSGSSIFGQKPATTFGGFGSTSGQANPFGSTPFGQSQPAFGSSSFGSGAFGSSSPAFGSSPFGSTPPPFGTSSTPAFSTPAFGVSSTPAFGVSSTPVFGVSSTPAFGVSSTPAFGISSTPAFGVSTTPAFGVSTTPAFGVSSTPAFGVSSTPAFGVSSTPAFGVSSTPTFGISSTPAFGISTTPAFGASSTPAFGTTSGSLFGSTSPLFGQSTPAFGSTTSAFGSTSLFGTGVSPFGTSSTPAFGSAFGATPFGGQRPGSRGTAYSVTNDVEAGVSGQPGKLMSISAMPAYKDKSHEELRWEDYQAGDKGGPNPVAQPTATGIFGQTASSTPNPFAAATGSIFGPKPVGSFGMTTSAAGAVSPFGSLATSSTFSTASSQAFGISSPFGAASTPGFGASSTTFGTSFSTTPSFASPTPSIFSGGTSVFASSPFAQSQAIGGLYSSPTTPAMAPTMFGSSLTLQAQKPGSFFGAFQTTPQTMPSFSFPAQSQPAVGTFGITSVPGTGTTLMQQPSVPVPVSSPFGILPALPQMSIGRTTGAGPSVQYGISSLPVSERATPVRTTSLLTPRHITQRSRIRLLARRYHPSKESPKVSFFSEGEETPHTPVADALFVPRENPRALYIQHKPDRSPSRSPANSSMKLTDTSLSGKQAEQIGLQPGNLETSDTRGESESLKTASEHTHKGNGYVSITGHRAEEAAIAYEHGADIEALMPKLRQPDYYIQPRVQELAAKERAEPGYCRRVNDFVVGRHEYGFIKFLGETDVRGLDLEGIVQFNKCEVLVYMDESKKPPPGMGLNKPAEITLLNVRCIDKKTGQNLYEGQDVEKFEKRLKKKTEEQGAQFLSYDVRKGEWHFRVQHFSKYSLEGT